jgi:hypothetical protein
MQNPCDGDNAMRTCCAICVLTATLFVPAASGQVQVDPDLPGYALVQGFSGSVKRIGTLR